MPRKSCFIRKLPISGGRKLKNGIISGGTTEEQVICSNIDIAFIVTGLDINFNIRRIERYITLAYSSGVSPVILLNKADLHDCISEYVKQVESVAVNIPVYSISALKCIGMDIFEQYLASGKTIVFLGSSGVGKSTIINLLLTEARQKTNEVSNMTGKGKHTTNKAELIFHSSGCMIIDTPGLRELQLWGTQDALEQSFKDIIDMASECKYKDCTHELEPGCAVREGIENGKISLERFISYKRQLSELYKLDKRIMQHDKSLSKKERLKIKMKNNKRTDIDYFRMRGKSTIRDSINGVKNSARVIKE